MQRPYTWVKFASSQTIALLHSKHGVRRRTGSCTQEITKNTIIMRPYLNISGYFFLSSLIIATSGSSHVSLMKINQDARGRTVSLSSPSTRVATCPETIMQSNFSPLSSSSTSASQ